jgi:hypothetical protein
MRVKALFAVFPAWWTMLDRPSLAGLAAVKDDRGLRAMFQLAGELAAQLTPVDLYRLEPTEDIEVRDGRAHARRTVEMLAGHRRRLQAPHDQRSRRARRR